MTQKVIEALYKGTANAPDVYRALGWKLRPHAQLWMRLGKYEDGRLTGLARITYKVDDALWLIDYEYQEVAMREAMTLTRAFPGHGSIARRICVIALTRPQYQSEHARPG